MIGELPRLPQEIGNPFSTTEAIPSPTFTMPTPYPTLTKALQEQLYVLFQTNANCEFPCFLGITPGESNLREAFAFFEKYSASHRVFTLDVTFETPYQWYHTYAFSISRDNYTMPVDVEIQADGENTRGLIVHIDDGQGTDKEQIQEHLLRRYGLTELLQRHGVPDEVYLQPPKAQPPPPASPSRYEWYILDVVYQQQKIFASYPGWARFSSDQGKYKLCPEIGDGQIDTFSMAFADPALKELNMVEFMWGSFNPYFTLDWYRENMKPLDAKGLYERFIQHGQRCFYEDEYVLEVQEGR